MCDGVLFAQLTEHTSHIFVNHLQSVFTNSYVRQLIQRSPYHHCHCVMAFKIGKNSFFKFFRFLFFFILDRSWRIFTDLAYKVANTIVERVKRYIGLYRFDSLSPRTQVADSQVPYRHNDFTTPCTLALLRCDRMSSVCLSVTLEFFENNFTPYSRLVSLGCSLSADPNMTGPRTPRGTP